MGGYAYTDAAITQGITNSFAGATVAHVPKHTVSMWNRYDFSPFLGLGLECRASQQHVCRARQYRCFTGLYADGRGDVCPAEPVLRVQANIENIADINYIASADNNNNILAGAGRIFRLTAVANF